MAPRRAKELREVPRLACLNMAEPGAGETADEFGVRLRWPAESSDDERTVHPRNTEVGVGGEAEAPPGDREHRLAEEFRRAFTDLRALERAAVANEEQVQRVVEAGKASLAGGVDRQLARIEALATERAGALEDATAACQTELARVVARWQANVDRTGAEHARQLERLGEGSRSDLDRAGAGYLAELGRAMVSDAGQLGQLAERSRAELAEEHTSRLSELERATADSVAVVRRAGLDQLGEIERRVEVLLREPEQVTVEKFADLTSGSVRSRHLTIALLVAVIVVFGIAATALAIAL